MDDLPQELAPGVVLDFIGGNCPVQAEGSIYRTPFYFRARGEEWQLDVGPQDTWHGHGCWSYEEEYDGGEFAAGWVTQGEAMNFIAKAAEIYIADLAEKLKARKES